MAKEFKLTATVRENIGKGASRRLRHADQVPAVVYGSGKGSQSIILEHNALALALADEAFYTRIIDLDIAGKAEKVVLKDLQRHPYKPRLAHVDFLRISATEKLTMTIPLHFTGEDIAPGVKVDGGVISHLMMQVVVRCLPKDLPEYIVVDVSNLGLNQAVHLSNLQLPAGVELVDLAHGEDKSVINIHIPRAVVEAEAPAAAASAAVPTNAEVVAAAAAEEAVKTGVAPAAGAADKGADKGKEKAKK